MDFDSIIRDMKHLKRKAQQKLENYFNVPSKSPLVIFGPRQTGKTTLAVEFAKKHYQDRAILINFFKDARDKKNPSQLASIFEHSQDPRQVLKDLSLILKRDINPEKDILLIDEIQDCKPAYEILKNFKDDMPDFPIIASGSYLGLFLETESDIRHPVGCTMEFSLGPLSFSEFLSNFNPLLYQAYLEIDIDKPKISPVQHKKFLECLNSYFFTGGMPELVYNYINMINAKPQLGQETVRKQQNDLYQQYLRDLDKYAEHTDIPKIKKILEYIPLYLQKYMDDNVDRIRFNNIGKQFAYKSLKSSFDYLKYNGLFIQSLIVNRPSIPLVINREENKAHQFKAYLFDIGLLNAKLDCPHHQLFNPNMNHYKGYLVENFVAQQLSNYFSKTELFTYKRDSREGSAEVEFLVMHNGNVIPIEVKSSSKYANSKSLKNYISRYKPKHAFKLAPTLPSKTDLYSILPLYLVEKIFEVK